MLYPEFLHILGSDQTRDDISEVLHLNQIYNVYIYTHELPWHMLFNGSNYGYNPVINFTKNSTLIIIKPLDFYFRIHAINFKQDKYLEQEDISQSYNAFV
jgi:hypothetical protein